LTNLAEIERMAEQYAKLKQTHENDGRLADTAARLVDSLSSPDFAFPLRDEALVSSGTTTYVYENGATYPNLFDFLSEILHAPIPIVINKVKFGPGEIIVGTDGAKAVAELRQAMTELQKMVHGKKAKAAQ
jgi:hypothetical protein